MNTPLGIRNLGAFALLLVAFILLIATPAKCYAPLHRNLSAVVDGSYSEWNLTYDFFANMYRDGDPAKALEARLYLRYSFDTHTVYALVLTASGVTARLVAGDAKVAIGAISNVVVSGTSGNNGIPPDFAWVGSNGTYALGFEASFQLAPGSPGIMANLKVNDGSPLTASTVNYPQSGIAMVIPPFEDDAAPPPFHPDLYLRPSTVPTDSGIGIYNLDGTNQTVEQSVGREGPPMHGGTVTYYVTTKNTGGSADTFTITSNTAPAGWDLVYTANATDITSAMTTSGWTTPLLNPDDTQVITVTMSPGPTALGGVAPVLTVTVTSDGNPAQQDVGKMVTDYPVIYRPDVTVRPSTVATYSGFGIYNLDGTGQTVGQSTTLNTLVTYYVSVRNYGNVPDTYTITGTAAPAGWTVIYKNGATVITGDVTTSGWITPVINPAGTLLIAVYVTPGSTATPGVGATQTITMTSIGDPTKQDVGKLVTSYPIIYQPDVTLRPSTVTTYSGVKIYNLDGTNQTVSQSVPIGTQATYYVLVRNYGNVADTFTITGSAAPDGWTVAYKAGATLITSDVTTTGWTTPVINVGGNLLITVYVTPTSAVLSGAMATQTITMTSIGDPTKQDVGVIQTTAN